MYVPDCVFSCCSAYVGNIVFSSSIDVNLSSVRIHTQRRETTAGRKVARYTDQRIEPTRETRTQRVPGRDASRTPRTNLKKRLSRNITATQIRRSGQRWQKCRRESVNNLWICAAHKRVQKKW